MTTIQTNPTINVMAEAHKMAKAWGKENGHYAARLKAGIKMVWAMVKEAAKFNPEIKANTGAVKMAFSEEKKVESENLNEIQILGYYVERNGKKRVKDIFIALEENIGYSPVYQHFNVRVDYLEECDKISKDQYLKISKGYFTPKEYL